MWAACLLHKSLRCSLGDHGGVEVVSLLSVTACNGINLIVWDALVSYGDGGGQLRASLIFPVPLHRADPLEQEYIYALISSRPDHHRSTNDKNFAQNLLDSELRAMQLLT